MRLLKALGLAISVILIMFFIAGACTGAVVFAMNAPVWMSVSLGVAILVAILTLGFYL